MGATPKLLEDLLRAPAPSGYEGPASEVWRQAASFASLSTDALGSSIARIGAEGAAPLLAVVGHIDEIGLVITHVDEKGFLYFAPIGGWDAQILIGQRVQVQTRTGAVPGVVGRKPIHLLKEEQRKKVVELREMHIDIGAADEEEALDKVRIGDPVVIAADPVRLAERAAGVPIARQSPRRLRRPGGAAAGPRARGLRRGRWRPWRRCRRRSAPRARRRLPSRSSPTSRWPST